ncbi:MAG: hypothetical protein VW338_08620 [Rhodospirillaceae bacterium]
MSPETPQIVYDHTGRILSPQEAADFFANRAQSETEHLAREDFECVIMEGEE